MSIWTDLTGVEFELTWVDAGGVPTRSLQAGPRDGEPVVFLHGTSGHLEAFSRNIIPHAEAGFRCHAIDMLGHGYTGKPDYPYEIPRYVQHLEDYLDAATDQPVHLVGESLGGWVAAVLAADKPERLASLQLVAPGGTKANPQVMDRIRNSTREAVNSDDDALVRQRLELLMADAKDVSDELVEVRAAIYHSEEFRKNLDNLLILQDMETRQRNLLREDTMRKITTRTLIVWGRDNPFGEIPEAETLNNAIEGSRLELFDHCGHWPQHEHPELYNPLSIEFLRA